MSERTRRWLGAMGVLLVSSACEEQPPSRCDGAPFECPEEWAAWPMRGSAPARYRSDTEQVTDETTGLMWQRAASSDMFQWSEARGHCEDLELAGHSDWRLPSRLELITLVEYERVPVAPDEGRERQAASWPEPAIDALSFPETQPAEYWTESFFHGIDAKYSAGSERDLAWTVSFATGQVLAEPRELRLPRMRCVRTARSALSSTSTGVPPASSTSAPPASSRYVIKTQTVTERATGLAWQRSGRGALALEEAEEYCSGLTLDGLRDFRLPHVKELLTLAAATAAEEPYVDAGAFDPLGASGGTYWSSTPGASVTVGSRIERSNLCVDFADRGRNPGPSTLSDDRVDPIESVRCVSSAESQP